jgi:hypothetical protein
MNKTRVLAASIILMCPYSLNAQSTIKIIVDEDGKCPATNVLRGFPRVTQPTVGVGATLTKVHEVSLYRSDDQNDRVNKTLPFNTKLTVYGYSSNEKRLFVKAIQNVGGDNREACGWVAVDSILLPRSRKFIDRGKTPQPLQMKDISKQQEAAQNLLNVKAVVHNLSIAGDASGIDIFEDPIGQKGKSKIRLFDAFLVFDEMTITAEARGQETRYWLIGTQGRTEIASLKGWIRQRDVVIWPSRLALAWNEAATISGFATPQNLDRKVGQLTIGNRIERADYIDQITRRLPVLEQSPAPDKVADDLPSGGTLDERRRAASNIVRYYKIATPGRACRKDNPADCLSARQIDAKRQQVTTVTKAAAKADILILIDATESMDPFLPSTVRTINKFVTMAENEDVRKLVDLRFAISSYGDYQGEEASVDKVDYQEIVPFFKPVPGMLGSASMLQTLMNHPKSLIFRDVHKDRLEAPFAAAIRALKTAKWRPQAEVPLRFIIHVGDAGSRVQGETSATSMKIIMPQSLEAGRLPQSSIREIYREEDVVSALKGKGVIYVPLAIKQGSTLAPTPTLWNLAFEKQMNRILELLGMEAAVKRSEEAYASDPPEILDKTIADAVLKIWTAVQVLLRCQQDSLKSFCSEPKSAETIKSPEVVALVNRMGSIAAGLNNQEIENIYSRDQSIVTMYSPARSVDGQEMFSHWVALERKEFMMIRDLLKTLCASMSQRDARGPVNEALLKFAEAYSNEDLSGLTVREILGKRLGIPNLERTDLSGRSREEIDDAYRAWESGDKETWENWHERACKAMYFTQMMQDDRSVDYNEISCELDKGTCYASDASIRKFRWNVEVSFDSPTYYVPLDVLP